MTDFCAKSANIWQLVGKVVTALKIAIPAILMIIAFVTLAKAFVSGDDKLQKEAWGSLAKKAILAIVIFFVPTLVNLVMGLVTPGGDSKICTSCIASPNGSACAGAASKL